MGIKYTSTPKGMDAFLVRPVKPLNTGEAYKQFIKADALRFANHFRESIKHYLSSIMIDRNNYRAYFGLGVAYKAEEKYEKAIEMLEKARKMSYFMPDIHHELGICYIFTNRITDALASFKTAIMMDKNNLATQLQLGVVHEMLEEYEMSELIYQSIIENDPTYLNAYNHLSALYMRLEEYKAAGSVLTQMVKINPEYYKAYLGLAICFDKMQNRQRAVHYYKLYLNKKPHSHHSAKIKNRIRKLAPEKQNEKRAKFVTI